MDIYFVAKGAIESMSNLLTNIQIPYGNKFTSEFFTRISRILPIFETISTTKNLKMTNPRKYIPILNLPKIILLVIDLDFKRDSFKDITSMHIFDTRHFLQENLYSTFSLYFSFVVIGVFHIF